MRQRIVPDCYPCKDKGYLVVGIGWRYCRECPKGRRLREDGERRGIHGK